MQNYIDIIPLVVMIVIFYLALFIPQRRKRKKHNQFISNIKIGDNVVTDTGIHGRVSAVKKSTVILVLKKGELEVNMFNLSNKL